uniref:Putative transcription factor mef2a n=1 Tax=Culex tarsalis TaxID=7177 RepID=A0A1Q3FGY2_CULTA
MESVYDHHQQDVGGGGSGGVIGNLYSEIHTVHWKFLDAEESMEKINLRRQLEDLIVQYICNMPHNRKFLLLPTVQVLQSSIAKMEDFSAYKASIGFEAISQYANNLFTKPWRKEYKVIKMYSGFYQHEIAANLVGAEALFEQMGYKTLPNKTLVLDGPICPDRVTNVSRDAITATVECQIMKEIFAQLTDMKLAVNWSDIYSFRELNTMNVEQTVQNMAMLIQEKHHKNQQARRKESYGNPLVPAVSSCNSCNQYQFHPHMQQQQQQQHQHQQPVPPLPPSMVMPPPLTIPYCGPQPLYNTTPCNIHSQPPNPLAYGYHHHFLPNSPSQPPSSHVHPSSQSSGIPPHPPPPLGAITHSKSLEHYQDPAAAMYNLTACMQRHSIDQPPFDYAAVSSASHYGGPMGMAPPSSGVYDAVDGPCNMTPYSNHPYNVSGNRFPLPYNLSANLGGPCMNGGKQNGTESFYQPSINGYQQQQQQHVMPPYYHHRSSSNGQLYGQQQQQQSHRHTAAEIYMNHAFDSTGSTLPPSILSKKKSSYDDYDVPVPTRHHHPVEPKTHAGDLIYIDTREEAGKKERKKSDRNVRNADLLADYEIDMLPEALMERQHQQLLQQQHQNQVRHPYLHHQTSRNSRQSDFDSYEDEQLQAGAYQRASNVSKRISSKNQEGIGSYESWSYVFQNLEKQGYSKDLGERGDVLVVNPEDEDYTEGGNNSRGGTLKRSSNEKLKAMKPKAADKVDGIRTLSTRQQQQQQSQRENERNESAAARAGQKNALVQKVSKTSNSNTPDNSSQAKANHTSNHPTSSSNSRRNSITRKISTTSTTTKENGNSSSASGGGGILVNHSHGSTSTTTSGKKKTASFDTAAATIINPHDSSEWNCEFCTFLNPETRRICEMCSKSRDLNGATTTTTTSNGTATCV